MINNEIYNFYNGGAEIGRLENGLGEIECFRTKEILSRYIEGKNTIYDIGGGIGIYSAWLAKRGNDVHLLELADASVQYAKENLMKDCKFIAEVGDARKIDRKDSSADVVLLMGPLYHLQNSADRKLALNEAHRVLKKGGLLVVSGVSKYSSTTWALSTYGINNNYMEDSVFFNMLKSELTTGKHNRPKEYPGLIAEAYFSTPQEFENELIDSGFSIRNKYAVEGCIWFTPCLYEKWKNKQSRERLLDIIHLTENDNEIIGMSPHFLIIGIK